MILVHTVAHTAWRLAVSALLVVSEGGAEGGHAHRPLRFAYELNGTEYPLVGAGRVVFSVFDRPSATQHVVVPTVVGDGLETFRPILWVSDASGYAAALCVAPRACV